MSWNCRRLELIHIFWNFSNVVGNRKARDAFLFPLCRLFLMSYWDFLNFQICYWFDHNWHFNWLCLASIAKGGHAILWSNTNSFLQTIVHSPTWKAKVYVFFFPFWLVQLFLSSSVPSLLIVIVCSRSNVFLRSFSWNFTDLKDLFYEEKFGYFEFAKEITVSVSPLLVHVLLLYATISYFWFRRWKLMKHAWVRKLL